MEKIKTRIKNGIDKLVSTGFFSIFLSNVLCKIICFFGGIVIVRILSKNDYGIYSYIMNCYVILFFLNDIGCSVSMSQFCSENHNNEEKFNDFFVYGFKKAILFSTITSLVILLSPFFYPYANEEAKHLTKFLCLIPQITTTNSFLLNNARIRLKNNMFAKINIFSSIINYIVIIPMAHYFGIIGALLSNYIINISILIFSFVTTKDILNYKWKNCGLTKSEKYNFFKLGFASQLNDGMASLLTHFDIFLIGLIIADMTVISSYKVGMTIPTALSFIPSSIMIYTVPYFARNRENKAWIKSSYKKIVAISAIFNSIITLGGIMLSRIFIPLIFGKQYTDAVRCFNVLMIGYFFSATFRIPSENVIYTQRKVKINIIITAISGAANCILDIVFIKKWGAIGAAFATMLVNIFSGLITFGYMCYYLKGGKSEKKTRF